MNKNSLNCKGTTRSEQPVREGSSGMIHPFCPGGCTMSLLVLKSQEQSVSSYVKWALKLRRFVLFFIEREQIEKCSF